MTVEQLRHIFPSIAKDKIERILRSADRHGANRRAIARETGIEVSLVFKIIKKAGIQTLHRHYHADSDILRELHGLGKTDHEIAEQMHLPGSAVTTKRQRLGLTANKSERWPELEIGTKQKQGHLEIASRRDAHSRYEVICHCPIEKSPHKVGKRVYVGHFNAYSVKSCGRDTVSLFLESPYAKNRRAAAIQTKLRQSEIMAGLSFQTCVVLHLCDLKLKGYFRMNDRALLEGKEIDLVFPRVGEPQILVEINENNHECTAARKRDCQKRDLAMFKYPTADWITITQRSFLENPEAEIGKIVSTLKRRGLLLHTTQ
jgi:hypothetical protein